MSDILNLALKKDIYESINNGTTDKIVIEWTNWWNKRLKDIDTGKFKDFVAVRISCGSAVKFDYPIVSIEQIKRNFVITVDNQGSETYDADVILADAIKTTEMDTTEIETIEKEIETESTVEQKKDEYVSPEIEIVDEYTDKGVDTKERTDDYTYEVNLKNSVNMILDNFCKFDNVYNVNAPVISILPSGKIIGSSKRLVVDKDCETRIPFENVEVVKYKSMLNNEFLDILNFKLTEYLTGKYYIFINRKACGFTKRASGEDVLVLRMTVRKSYLIGR